MTDTKPYLPSLQSAANDPILLDILQTVQLKAVHLATGRQQGVSIPMSYVVSFLLLNAMFLTHTLFYPLFLGCMEDCHGYCIQQSFSAVPTV